MSWMIIEIDNRTSMVGELNLKQKQEIVGGYIEHVDTKQGLMIVNEEGLIYGLPINNMASVIANKPIVGRVLMEVEE